MQEMWIQSLGWEDPLERETATHSSILAWEISETEQPGGLQSMELQRVRDDLVTKQQSNCHTRSIFKCWENWNFGVYISNWPSFMKEREKSKSGTPKSKFVSCLSWSEPVLPTPHGVFHGIEYEWGRTGPSHVCSYRDEIMLTEAALAWITLYAWDLSFRFVFTGRYSLLRVLLLC